MLAITLAQEVAFGGNILISSLDISILLLSKVLDHVLLVQEIGLSCRGDKSLPLMILPLKHPGALIDQQTERDHHWVVSNLTYREISVTSLNTVNCCVGQTMAQICVTSVRWRGSDCVCWIQVLDGQVHVVMLLSILSKV